MAVLRNGQSHPTFSNHLPDQSAASKNEARPYNSKKLWLVEGLDDGY